MQLLYALGMALMVVFSLALGWYVTQFKLVIRGTLSKGIVFAALGSSIFLMTFAVTVFIVWPPLLPL